MWFFGMSEENSHKISVEAVKRSSFSRIKSEERLTFRNFRPVFCDLRRWFVSWSHLNMNQIPKIPHIFISSVISSSWWLSKSLNLISFNFCVIFLCSPFLIHFSFASQVFPRLLLAFILREDLEFLRTGGRWLNFGVPPGLEAKMVSLNLFNS